MIVSLVLLFLIMVTVDSSNVQKESIPTSWHGGRWRPGRPLKRSALLGSEDTPATHRWWSLDSESENLGPLAEERLKQQIPPRVAEFDQEPVFLADGFGMGPEIGGARDQIPPPQTHIVTPNPDPQKPAPSELAEKRASEIPSTADRALSTASRLSF
ncbi:hypothetical protein FO519_009188 [Halicephalobus sp. NKZ332]|nr:hypothetical protein FO519_009188 [Halicephalobus sp. NKZ332]